MMDVVNGLENLGESCEPTVLTIGNFDGVHRGHQKIIQQVSSLAEVRGLTSTVMTFDQHPLRLLAPERSPEPLMPMDMKLSIMERFGARRVVVAKCTKELLGLEPGAFVREVVVGAFRGNVKFVVEGPNFCFGKDRAGTIDFLVDRGREVGFETILADPVEVDLPELGRRMVSSSLVRQLLGQGRVDLASMCLGRPYELVGNVIYGVGRGKGLGFPTANLATNEQMLPADGIYAARVRVDDCDYPAAANIGPVPTFDEYKTVVEAFLIDFEGDLYGRRLGLKLVRWLRSPQKFETVPALVEQMHRDVTQVRQILAESTAVSDKNC